MKKFFTKKLPVILLAIMVGLLSANLSAYAVHHMDVSDCDMEISCDHCCIPAPIPISFLDYYSDCLYGVEENFPLFKSNVKAPGYSF